MTQKREERQPQGKAKERRVTKFPAIFLVVAGLCFCLDVISAADSSATLTAANFRNPPISARPGAFWNWLNGNTDRERIKYDLQQMKEKGMSGAEIWDVAAVHNGDMIPAGPEFLSPESASTIRFALSEGRKLGLRMGMITSSGWNAGGTWVDPTWASKMLVHSSMVTTGPMKVNQALPYPELPKDCPRDANGNPLFAIDVAVLAVPDNPEKIIKNPKDIIDLTDALSADGTLRWQAPEGAWRIFRFVCTNTGQSLIVPSPKSSGLFIDFLDPDATRRHMQEIMDRLEITPANAAESGLNYLEVDSMELHEGNPWTDKFPQWFQKYHSYDVVQWLPILAGWTIEDKDTSDRFLYDYKKTVSDLLIHSHYETGSKFLEEYGMEFVGEAGGPGPPIWDTCPVDALKALGNVGIPRGEFWIQHRNMFLIKEVASASHIYGKPIVDAESFTTWRRWEDSPFVLKMAADRAFAEGLNRLTIHGYAHSPDNAGLPGWTYHAGIDINPNTTWWPYARPFMDYLSRCSYLLQQGLPVADVLWYYGDQAPNFFPKFHDVPEKPRLPGLGRGYDYDVVNSDVILNRLKVKNGRFVLPEGITYKVLAFPPDASMPLEVLEKIESFVDQGGVVVGTPPKQTPGLFEHQARTKALQEIASQMWGAEPKTEAISYGKGKVYGGTISLDDVLNSEGVSPDFVVDEAIQKDDLDYIHRKTDTQEIYFVRNSATKPQNARIRFRVKDRTPELWNPATGVTRPCKAVASEGDYTAVDLDLDSGGSTFLIFSNKPSTTATPQQEQFQALEPLTSWTLSFPEGWGAPTSTTLTSLQSWTESEDPAIRYFSGTGQYRTAFDYTIENRTSSTQIFIDLGAVNDVAEIEVNGQKTGIAWKPPYRVQITDQLKTGRNDLSVKITNQWHNRLVGDSQTTATARYTKTNNPLPNKDTAKPLPSGLLGPVSIVVQRE